jgi:hypothetical protein
MGKQMIEIESQVSRSQRNYYDRLTWLSGFAPIIL